MTTNEGIVAPFRDCMLGTLTFYDLMSIIKRYLNCFVNETFTIQFDFCFGACLQLMNKYETKQKKKKNY